MGNSPEVFIISRYLNKFVGKYRVVANYDKNTNDFPRKVDGLIDQDFDDIYISCQGGSRIYHYGGRVLSAYIPSIGKGRNILKNFYFKITGNDSKDDFTIDNIFDYDKFYDKLKDKKLIIDVSEYSDEMDFMFHVKYIDEIAELMKAKTSGANTKPFSVKNLPKRKYQIPMDKLALYKAITNDLSQSDIIRLGKITNRFITEIMAKKVKINGILDIKADMKLKCLKGKNYIYEMEFFDDYIEYLKKNLSK